MVTHPCPNFTERLFNHTTVKLGRIWMKNHNSKNIMRCNYSLMLCSQIRYVNKNKVNLRDLIAATGLVVLLKLDSNHRFFWSAWPRFDGWHGKTIGHLYCVISSFVHPFVAIGEFKHELQSGNAKFGSKSIIFCPVWPWNLTDDIEKQ